MTPLTPADTPEIALLKRRIAELEAQESLLRIESEHLKQLYEQAPLAYQSLDVEGNFVEVNQAWIDVLGYTRDEIIGRNFAEFLHPEWRNHFKENFPRFKAVGEILGVEFEMIKKDGSSILVSFHGRIGKTPGGDFQQTHCIFQDITRQKRDEQALRASEERFRLAMEATRDGLWDWDVLSGKVYYSPSYWSMLGFDQETVPQHTEAWLEMIHPEDREAALHANTECIENCCESFVVEFRMLTRSGDWKWVQGRGKAVARDEQGRAARMIGTHVDITERKHTEEEREKLKAQLLQAQKLESVARLAGGVAHDFNNMLTVIQGHAELGMMGIAPDDPSYHRFKSILDTAQRSADLTQQLLAFARKQVIAPLAIDLNTTVESMLTMLRRLIGEDIDLAWIPGNSPWMVKADPTQMDQILVNLCVNARDAITGVGKIVVATENCTLETEYCAAHPGFLPGEYVRLSVSDNGCGMDQEVRAQIFDPFFTTKGLGKGTGLGLATVYGAVKQNNGFVNVYSEPGKGSVFSIYLPRHGGDSKQRREEDTPNAAIGGHETILVVEDEIAILGMATSMLQQLGYTVLTATSPNDALLLAEEHSGTIDLLLTDVIMPEMNGRALADRILTIQPGTKLLFMSGYTADIIAHQSVLAAGIHFLQKPFTRAVLAANVRQALDD